MKPVLSLIIVLIASLSYGQQRFTSKELTMGFSGLTNHQPTSYDLSSVEKMLEGKAFNSNFTDSKWFNQRVGINQFRIGSSFGLKRSKDFRKELLMGLHIEGQFQRRTFFAGTTETVEEEETIDVSTGRTLQLLSFETLFLSEIRDFIFVSPSIEGRLYINQRLGVHMAASLGVGAPLKNGLQVNSYDGQIVREIENDEVLSETRSNFGDVEFDWMKSSFSLNFKSQVSASVEIKPFELRPLYASVGVILGQQFRPTESEMFTYSGVDLGIISRF